MRNLLFLALLLFGGCSSSSKNSNPSDDNNKTEVPDDNKSVTPVEDLNDSDKPPSTPPVSEDETMELNRAYKVYTGDRVEDLGDARVTITRNSENGYSEVTLIEGEAVIVRAE
jgi:hypothetical protein